jgi:hypothetical protein
MLSSLLRWFAPTARSLTFAAAGSLLMVSGASPAQAQRAVSYVANVPFAFHVNSQLLPAGKYDIRPDTIKGGLRLREIDGKHSAFVQVYNGEDARNETAVVRFTRYGNDNFLRDFSAPPNGPGWRSVSRCSVTRAERRVQKEWVQTKQTFTTVALNVYPQH